MTRCWTASTARDRCVGSNFAIDCSTELTQLGYRLVLLATLAISAVAWAWEELEAGPGGRAELLQEPRRMPWSSRLSMAWQGSS